MPRQNSKLDKTSPKPGSRIGSDGQAPVPQWTVIEFNNCGLQSLTSSLFRMEFLTKIYLTGNHLSTVPSGIDRLQSLTVLDLSNNRLEEIPPSLGNITSLRELLLFHNRLMHVPFELGKLFLVHTLGLSGNPLVEPLRSFAADGTEAVMNYLVENVQPPMPPPERQWIHPSNADQTPIPMDAASVSLFCYNILCDKYATRHLYGYCPAWALDWEYRKKQILGEILKYNSMVVSLQEVETREFFDFLRPKLRARGYEGMFRPKSRARTMGEHERKSIDGCALFYKSSEFTMVSQKLVEFGQLATQYSSCAAMLNRVMPKDNVGLIILLEHVATKKRMLVCNAHLTWDPVYKDVKVIQTVLFMKEIESAIAELNCPGVPLLLSGDFNSLPDSGVVHFLREGKISEQHPDFEGHDYSTFARAVPFRHSFQLQSAYNNELPYTNYTYDFTGIIDYIWFSADTLTPKTLLGPVDPNYMKLFAGNPNPYFASDHMALCADFALRSSR
eukprot:m.486927 g.486927  ORF g.486927 m.486927 type:complete len:501 (+) comp24689_c0_seq1:140-1642(+)